MQQYLDKIYFGNTVEEFLWFLAWFVLGFIFQKIISKLIVKLLVNIFYRYTEDVSIDEFDKKLNRPIKNTIFIIVFFLAFSHLNWPPSLNLTKPPEFGLILIIQKAYSVIFAIAITFVFVRIADCLNLILTEKALKTDTKQDDQLIPFVVEIIKIFVWITSVLIILSNIFDLNIGTLVAGLGVGGLAIALAAQDTLSNLFGSFTIFFDKPFVVGDLVTVGNITGVVEKVGFRSTRIRTLEKSYVTLPNKKMIDAELDNLSLRTFRRVNFNIGLTYNTTSEQLKTIVKEIQDYIDEHPNTNQEGEVKFMEFGDSSLNIMVLYYINTMDWSIFLKIKEEINYKVMDIVEQNNCSFAFPSTSVYIENNNN